MRRALLVAAVAAPAMALAQVQVPPSLGQLREVNTFDVRSGNSYINRNHCDATPPTPVHLEWNLAGANVVSTGTYRIFASNKPPVAAEGTTRAFCAEEDSTNGTGGDTRAGQIGSFTPSDELQDEVLEDVTAAAIVAEAGRTCSAADENQPVYVCVHYYEGTNRLGAAIGTFMIQRSAPNPPGGVEVGVGDTRLEVSWDQNTSGTVPDRYVAEAIELAPGSFDPVPGAARIASQLTTGRRATIPNLTNGTRYAVFVRAFSVGGNSSGDSAPQFGMPEAIDDFWETYTREGGREQGGCGSGPGGSIALLAVAGLLAALRRRS